MPSPTEVTPSEPLTPGALTAPGTTLAVGDSAVVHARTSLAEGETYWGYAEFSLTVTSIEQADPVVFEQFSNAEEFAGKLPWVVKYDVTYTVTEGTPNGGLYPALEGVLADGSGSGGVVSLSGFDDICRAEYADSFAVGETAHLCTIKLTGVGGAPLAGVRWNGDDYADGSGTENPYSADPVTWLRD